jgi:dihydrofolate reductase
MGKLVVTNHMTLDGVMQAPGRADEDTRDGFEQGGWAAANTDEVMAKALGWASLQGGQMLFGRVTYEHFYDFWPKQTDGNPFTPVLNRAQKYVVSTTLEEPLPWENSTLIADDVPGKVAEIKARADVVVLGSGNLIQTLLKHELVDEFVLMIHPIVLGAGRRLFPEGSPVTKLELDESVTTTTGVLIGRYRP